jgi:hypothetical protein
MQNVIIQKNGPGKGLCGRNEIIRVYRLEIANFLRTLSHAGIVPRAQKKKTQARANCSAVPTQLALLSPICT